MFTSTQIKYLNISLLAKYLEKKFYVRKISSPTNSPTNQNVEEINIARKYLSRRRNYYWRNHKPFTTTI